MSTLESVAIEFQKLRIYKMESFVYDSNNPVSDIVNFFKKDCKSFETRIIDGMRVNSMVMSANWLGKPKENVTVIEDQGELLSIGIHGNSMKVRKEYNKLVEILQNLDKTPEGYIGLLGERKGYSYFGNMFADYVFGVSKNVQVSGDTIQVFIRNPYKD
jgi:hypothetical protein